MVLSSAVPMPPSRAGSPEQELRRSAVPRTSFSAPRGIAIGTVAHQHGTNDDPALVPLPPSPEEAGSSPFLPSNRPFRSRRPSPTGPIVIPPRAVLQEPYYVTPSPIPSVSTSSSIWPPPPPASQPRGPRLDVPVSSVPFNPGWTTPFPSVQLEASPPRPKRPARPDEALMFASPLPFPGYEQLMQSPTSDTTAVHGGIRERVDLSTFLHETTHAASPSVAARSPISPISSTHSFGRVSPSKRRKPVPKYESSPVRRGPASPRGAPPPTSPARSARGQGIPATPNRLSIGGFEALLARGVPPVSSFVGAGRKRGLGDVDEEDLAAPRHRSAFATDESPKDGKRRATFHGDGIGFEMDPDDNTNTHTSGLIGSRKTDNKTFSWSEKLRQSPWIPAWTARKDTTGRRASRENVSRDVGIAPVLATSDNPGSIQVISHNTWKKQAPSTAAKVNRNFVSLPLHNTPQQSGGMRRRSSAVHREEEKANKGLGEVIVMPGSWENESIYAPEPQRELILHPMRIKMSALDYRNRLMRLVYLFYSLLIVFPIPATLFLDYNVIYALVQIALSPSLPTASVLTRRDLVGVPTLRSSTPWWIATGLYAGCTMLWIFVVCIWLGFVRGYVRHWHRGDVAITKVYQNLTSFHSASLSSFSTFSMLWRVRLAPLLRSSILSKSVVGNRRSDWFIETCHYYRQAGLSLALLLLFGTTAYGSASAVASSRDTAYFNRDGTLTSFSVGFLMANLVWAAWHLLLWSLAVVGIGLYKLFPSSSHPFTAASDSSLLDLTRTVSSDSGQPSDWRSRRDRRLRAAILLCLPRSSRSFSSLSARHTSESKGGPFHAKSISSPELLQAPPRPAPLGLAPQSVRVAKRDERAGSTAGKEKENRTMHMDATQRQKMADLDYERRKLARDDAAATLSGQQPMASSPPGVRFPYVLPTPRISETPFMSREMNTFSDEAVRVPLPETSPEPTTRGISSPLGLVSPSTRQRRFAARSPAAPQLRLDLSAVADESNLLRPPLKSHFSLASDLTGVAKTSSPTTPGGVDFFTGPPATMRLAESEATRPSAATSPIDVSRTPNLSGVGEGEDWNAAAATTMHVRELQATRNLTDTVIERRRISERLLLEVQRLGEAEEAVRREERRLASLRRIGEVSSAGIMQTGLGVTIQSPSIASTRDASSPVQQERSPALPFTPQLGSLEVTPRMSEMASNNDPSQALLPPFRFSYSSPDTTQAGLAIDTDPDPGPATGDDSSRSLNPAAALLTTATISEAKPV
ncbi:BZ3500_MvSof-1268-A1-R1_Chr5-3g08295 [Microbotryum saponariae]|uniref:BZ3500_MvSof-1268-A1-R1_Chr5-3g08295 protein n=1 Tax=Microbotryum saponariae TaxID=289078 RepID=A0A2X0KLL5_9BASI|nr:BZ3500_MvSof-1268-A1-R1_Chr5-3g08295 [Microbotryum saponariae]SDA08403.1 BZ3501_MvSof-1269-A2-R1_Chr5-3g08023 [Microbotryum saponariae]